MKIPTIKKYKDALESNILTKRQLETLEILYGFPNATASLAELGHALVPNSTATIVASGQIGRVGKTLSNYLNITPPNYYNGRYEGPAWFLLIAEYYKESGYIMNLNLQLALVELGLVETQKDKSSFRLPTEILQFEESKSFKEGKTISVFVDKVERNQKARKACIAHHGTNCKNCGFSFGSKYGSLAEGFIHVHHLKPLSQIKKEYEVDPIKDLIPLCANCHSVIHLSNEILSLRELKKITKKSIS